MPSPNLLARPVVLRFSQRVRDKRLAAGMTMRELGQRAYMTDEFVRLIENGTANPSLISMALLALALDCEIADLLSE